jgi:protein-arginine deiminase
MKIDDPQGGVNTPFWNALVSGLGAQNVPLHEVDQNTYNFDRWVQDGMQLGYQGYMSGNGYTWLDDFNQLERDDGGNGLFNLVPNELLAKNQGMTYAGKDAEDSPNYGGNLEVIPPHTDAQGVAWPFGHLYHGGGDQGSVTGQQVSRHMNPKETDLLEAQGMQGPFIEISTEWLAVGHVDEISMAIADLNRTNNRPWKIAWASPVLAIKALKALQSAGQGNLLVYKGRQEQKTVSQIVNDTALMSYNDQVQARMDSNKQILMQACGLTQADFVELPVYYEISSYQGIDYGVSQNPGVQNCVPVNDTLYMPDPEGPIDPATGQDVWKTQINAALQPTGLKVTFVDVFTSYHELMGEAHCGSNVRYHPYDMPWWSK